VGSQFRVNLLIHYASRIGGYPIYMLYNYDPYISPPLSKIAGGIDQLWGCSIGSAQEIKNKYFDGRKTPPSFHDLHPNPCWPFYRLFEALAARQPEKRISQMLNGFDVDKLRRYSVDEIVSDPKFTDLTSPEILGFVDHFDKVPVLVERDILVNNKPDLVQGSEYFFRKRI
jgi:hypothetical protein